MKQESIINKMVYSDQPINHRSHFHYAYQIIFVIKGKIGVYFPNKEYIAGPKTLTFISNLEEHSIKVLEEPYIRYFIIISPALADQLIRDAKLLTVFKNRPLHFNHVFEINAIFCMVSEIFKALFKESRLKDEYTEESIVCLLKELLVCLYRNNKEQFPVPKKNIKSQIYEVQKYIDQNFKEDLRILDLAEHFYISPYYLTHCFKDLTGYSPKEYLMLNRLSFAKAMILNTDFSIKEIVFKSGFNDVNNFIKHFKKYYKTTPNYIRTERR